MHFCPQNQGICQSDRLGWFDPPPQMPQDGWRQGACTALACHNWCMFVVFSACTYATNAYCCENFVLNHTPLIFICYFGAEIILILPFNDVLSVGILASCHLLLPRFLSTRLPRTGIAKSPSCSTMRCVHRPALHLMMSGFLTTPLQKKTKVLFCLLKRILFMRSWLFPLCTLKAQDGR